MRNVRWEKNFAATVRSRGTTGKEGRSFKRVVRGSGAEELPAITVYVNFRSGTA